MNTLKASVLAALFMLMIGCSGISATYKDGTHWGILDSATGHKCLDVTVEEGAIEATGIWKYLQGFSVNGKNVHYRSVGNMCNHNAVEHNLIDENTE